MPTKISDRKSSLSKFPLIKYNLKFSNHENFNSTFHSCFMFFNDAENLQNEFAKLNPNSLCKDGKIRFKCLWYFNKVGSKSKEIIGFISYEMKISLFSLHL